MPTCQRCTADIAWTQNPVVLFGGVKAHLCIPCQNEGELYFATLPIYDEWITWLARDEFFQACALAQQPRTEQQYLDQKRWYLSIAQRGAKVVQVWLTTRREPAVMPIMDRGLMILEPREPEDDKW